MNIEEKAERAWSKCKDDYYYSYGGLFKSLTEAEIECLGMLWKKLWMAGRKIEFSYDDVNIEKDERR